MKNRASVEDESAFVDLEILGMAIFGSSAFVVEIGQLCSYPFSHTFFFSGVHHFLRVRELA